ncbi:MAG TPA: serine/threonine protein phosphatase [Lachnospiraceae bacterium]|nr:serine/threonine protein phosphatase [Lachnospiraceae bacterium]
MIYEAYLISHGGCVRANNEDNGYLDGRFREDDGTFSWERTAKAEDCFLAAVFDGMGGEENGEVASRIAAETMAELSGEGTAPFSRNLETYVRLTGERILSRAGRTHMGTTYTALSIEKDLYFFSNLGDSRGYLYRSHRLTQMTKDHNMVRELYLNGVITKEQADRHPDRHTLYQYLGIRDDGEGVLLEPHTADSVEARPGDVCLLCSDGLTDMLEDEAIAGILEEESGAEAKARRLVQEALDAGGRDNVTVAVVVSFDGEEGGTG